MKRLLLMVTLLVIISGCAFWDGFTRGLTDSPGLEASGRVTGNVVRDSVPLLPSPWREIAVGCLAGAAGWLAKARKRKVH